MDPLSSALTVALLLLPSLLLIVGVVLFVRLWRSGALRDGLAYIVYLNGRRTLFVGLFLGMTVGYVLAGIVGTLGSAGNIDPSLTSALSSVCFFIGSLALLFLLWWGLRPRPTTVEERAVLAEGVEAHRAYAMGVIDQAESLR